MDPKVPRPTGAPGAKHARSAEVIKQTGIYGTNPQYTEGYSYGRFRNPMTLQWEGVGLIQFENY
ncbi:MAG: hypothetical protein ABIV06_03880 [Thermoanaerobaculia bacterium]